MRRNWLTGFTSFAIGVLASLALLELMLRLVPVCKGSYGAEPDPNWPAHHLIPQSTYTFSTGWDLEDVRRGRVNNLGYVAPFDFKEGTSGVFVVGDSFIENQMNDYAESVQGILPNLLERPMPVLGFGTSGATLPHDLGLAALISQRFNPTWAVVLITRGNFVGGFARKPGYFGWKSGLRPAIELIPERRHSRVVEFFRDLSLVAYARSNLRADFSTLFANRTREKPESCTAAALSAADEQLLQFAAAELPSRFNLPPSRVIWVFDTDRNALYDAGTRSAQRCPPRDALAQDFLAKTAAEGGMKVIDMEPVFRTEYLKTREHFDYLPVDGHWNGIAHALAAREVARYINARLGESG